PELAAAAGGAFRADPVHADLEHVRQSAAGGGTPGRDGPGHPADHADGARDRARADGTLPDELPGGGDPEPVGEPLDDLVPPAEGPRDAHLELGRRRPGQLPPASRVVPHLLSDGLPHRRSTTLTPPGVRTWALLPPGTVMVTASPSLT